MAGFYKLIQTRLMYTSRRVLLVKKMFCVENPMTLILFPILSSYFDGQHAIYKCGFNLFYHFSHFAAIWSKKRPSDPLHQPWRYLSSRAFLVQTFFNKSQEALTKSGFSEDYTIAGKAYGKKTTLVHSKTHSFLKST